MNTAKLPGNYFAPQYYVQSDPQTTLLHDRAGERLIALPAHFLLAIDETFRQETGKAAPNALYTCGLIWGEAFSRRFNGKLEQMYGLDIADVSLLDYLLAMRQLFSVHGFGMLDLDFTHRDRGVVVVGLSQSMVAPNTLKSDQPVCHLEAGIFAGWFSALSGRSLGALQTECMSQGAAGNRYIVLESDQLPQLKRAVAAGRSHAELLAEISTF